MSIRRGVVITLSVVVLTSNIACSKRRKKNVVAEETTTAAAPAAKTLLDKFPANDADPSSKSYPLRLITTENLLGRTKEGGAPSDWPFVLVDARTRVEYENEHIPGAINCPAEQVEQRLPSLVSDKSKEIVFYCNGPNCTKSHKAGRSAIASGFGKSIVYDEGLPAWKKASLPVAGEPLPKVELAKLDPTALNTALKSKAITVVDIRPRDEFLTFRIAGALNIALDDLESKLKQDVKTTQAICVVDYTGHQQEVAARLLTKLGFSNVKGLQDGMRGWQTAQLPVDKGLDNKQAEAAKGAEPAKVAATKLAKQP